MIILTGTRKAGTPLSLKDLDLGLPYEPGRIIAAIALSTAGACAPDTEGSEVFGIVKDLYSAASPVAECLVKAVELGESARTMTTLLGDRDPSLQAKVAAAIDVLDDAVSLAKAAFPPLGDNVMFQTIGHCVTAGALVVDLWGAAREKPEPLFGLSSVPGIPPHKP